MALFKRKTKQAAEPTPQISQRTAPELIWTRSFNQSSNYRGFRRVKLRTHGEQNVDDTLAYFRESKFDFKNSTIQLDHYLLPNTRVNGNVVSVSDEDNYIINVFVDGKRIGVVHSNDPDKYVTLSQYEYDAVSLKVDEKYHADGTVMGQNVYLFVHYIGEEPPKPEKK